MINIRDSYVCIKSLSLTALIFTVDIISVCLTCSLRTFTIHKQSESYKIAIKIALKSTSDLMCNIPES